MNVTREPTRKPLCNKPLKAGLLLGLLLFVLAMAQFKALHHFLHTDAAAPDHQCAVTLLTSGQVDSASPEVQVAVITSIVVACPQPAPLLLPVADYSLLPGRGPPASLL
ncbi:MAG: hypothetical protein KIS67_15710 [Verrucomicrobiae bacterium]|nr:hypothetical protein [Verrucomicrobiae bacterium]